ncbi:stage IV sporulation protein FA [Melghirimyces profundicolus]|uniref:Stage IV sporulation protein FA n=2 Tax=Melghirimyces profundicolus TaxID=1242148 RepID=A0A2T6BTJ0_9BACL|nr:stage IV sporulation protein FA [Melghirimyces profundicolus]
MREWSRGVSKRREKRVREIKEGKRFAHPGDPGSGFRLPSTKKQSHPAGKWDELPWNRSGDWMGEGMRKKKESRLLIQVFLSFFLLTGTYLVFQTQTPSARVAQAFIAEVMERDYNFEGVARWYERNIGSAPAFLPAFEGKNSPSGDRKPVAWVAPLKGEVVRPYREGEKGVVIRATSNAPVVSAAEGWVVEAGPEKGLGQTVVIRHADGQESWYGWLGKIRVKEKDWVKARELLGEVGGRDGEPLLFFALKQGGEFVDPTGVVPIE